MEKSQDLQGTLSQNINNNISQWTPEVQSPSRPWGQLVFITKKTKTLGMRLTGDAVDTRSLIYDLHKDTYSVGKYNCDITLTKNLFSTDTLNLLSRTHFIVKRTLEDGGPVILEDLSHNGTYVNGEKVGVGNKRVLESQDEISLAKKYSRVFVFQDWLGATNLNVPKCIQIVYYISKQIGSGSSSVVRLAYNKRSCERYAMKIVTKGNSVEGTDSKKIMNEVNMMKKLKHPFVTSMYDIINTTDSLFLVMEYMDRGDMQCYVIEKTLLEENEAKHLFYQIAEAVKYLHHQNIVHRDLKPQNVLLRNSLDFNITAKISDFGISTFLGQSYLQTKCGTPLYIAPEVNNNSDGYTEKADIWSLGIILYFSLCGKEPFANLEENQEPFCINFDAINSCARDLVEKMIEPNSVKRLSISEVLQHDWLKEDLPIKTILHPYKQPLTELKPDTCIEDKNEDEK
ncbi:ovarian-specific serine/threonine-protein kinase Lok-like [Ctenocephalides felis]|uniref:ovarian-specific serine/threonine-protein kinase Lok-like n=1 Tax=Ctenocephalides felis TaxID=7515 RepID=UPI000E6E3F7B|nr:ovarian-specific serine/threonine-protein kinase Lok-like [Ctenocephalides felis]XP_026473911.1 ovarian-specific serine/threonine-protein kinase Lok-like [Ctenocephalides felis]